MKLWAVCGVALAIAAVACGSDDEGGSSTGTGGSGGAGGSATGGSGGGGNCPADPIAAVGLSCSVTGQTCGQCADACKGCDIVTCLGGVWKTTAVPPDPSACSDGGKKDWCSTESQALCKSNQFCGFKDDCGLLKTGYCTDKPTTCDTSCTTVCGCNGKTYCNECEANKAGLSIDPSGKACSDAGSSDSGADSGGDAAGDAAKD